MQAEAYRSGHDQLKDELAWLEAGFRNLLEIGGGNPQANPLAGMRGLVVTADELLEAQDEEASPAEAWQRYIEERLEWERAIEASAEAATNVGIVLPFTLLCARLRLTAWERRFLVLCLAPELNRKYEKWLAYFNDDVTCKAPTPDLAYRLLCDSREEETLARRILGSGGVLRDLLLESEDIYGGAVNGIQARPRLKTVLRLDERTASYLLQTEELDARLRGFVEAFDSRSPADLPPLPHGDPTMESLNGFGLSVPSLPDGIAFIHLSGPAGGGKRLRMRHLSATRKQRLLVVALQGLPANPERAQIAMSRVVREAVLTDAAICLTEENAVAGAAVPYLELIRQALNEYARYANRPIVGWTSNLKRQASELPLPEISGLIRREVGIPDSDVREALWIAESGTSVNGFSEEYWREIADKYRFTPGQICNAWRQAQALAVSRGHLRPTREDLETACRGQFRHRLAQLADRIVPARTWTDLVLADEPRSLLKEACNRFLHRETVFERWGFGKKLPYGRGLSLLFAGPPGTGKTMAAEIVAGELGLELYRIDLSRIVSKYIGETEQRLSELFAEAENSGAILFFDEGDALFGKRTEVKDAHDKYANLEAAYLLQRIEAYDGVTILATNLMQNMDEALIRRMSFVVKFPSPGVSERELIFRAHLPAKAPLSAELDLAFLAARLDVSGGYIKNIVLAAAFLAASDRKAIGMEHFVRAARQEMRKMGKILVKDLFSPYDVDLNETFG